jgi:FkbM family methyltransferase
MRMLQNLLPAGAKRWVKEKGTRLLNVPWNRFNVPVSLMTYLKRGQSINLIDVGASQGEFSFSIENFCGVRKAMLIEPQPRRVEELKLRFPDPRFSIVCAAAAAQRGTVDMELLNWDYSSSLLPLRRDISEAYGGRDMSVRETISVCTATLDDICGGFLDDIDLLKIDVQGSEAQVMAGAKETLRRVRMIWMEVSFKPLYEGSETLESMIALCGDQGFLLTHLEEGFHSASNEELLQGDALFVRRL